MFITIHKHTLSPLKPLSAFSLKFLIQYIDLSIREGRQFLVILCLASTPTQPPEIFSSSHNLQVDLAILDTTRRHEYEFDTIRKNN